MKIKSRKTIETPVVLYDIVVDFGEDGTMTIFSHRDLSMVDFVLDKLVQGDCSLVDIGEEDLKDIEGISVMQTLEAPTENVNVVAFGDTQQIMVEICALTVDKE